MGRGRRRLAPQEIEIEELGKGGSGLGRASDGRWVQVKPAPPGARVAVIPHGRKRDVWLARRAHLVRPAPEHAAPRCAVFGLCGGCALQELTLSAQRRARQAAALRDVAQGLGWTVARLREQVVIHPVEGTDQAYGYRNKVELSFAPRRFLSEADHQRGLPIGGRFLGFHAPGRFDRVVDAQRCELIDEAANALLGTLRRAILHHDDQPLWDARAQRGVWRHALLRRGEATGEHLVGLYTTSDASAEAVERVAQQLLGTPLGEATLRGVVWILNDGVADVARGEIARVWGEATLTERLRGVSFQLSVHSFFQTNTAGAEVLVSAVERALQGAGGTLLDLYCGIGSLGLALAPGFERVIGVEEIEAAVADARVNAARAGVEGEWRAARVEHVIGELAPLLSGTSIVVDPPRVGLHPKVARAIAQATAPRLVYVACKPGSLGRDAAILAEGGWRLEELYPVDLFPHTGHIELVGRFSRA
ncbi:MAG: 23S rRNA (uracil(1939)-C(5))-methyltransferase RlmD [Deltaproteobacteria bacterium]|nr:MAG: 23S rRNA (uracil(1939)-C(5))-methyltransferase RlmD [Deltaproteobacteria bacterium]